ncbi:MAG: zinc ribbon domain-containing protein [Chitinophagales bacterium]|nr:zinc ribbon domain-containing protein [Chitinophagales bacterium]
MKCLQCQTELPSNARFCFNCGAPQIVAEPIQESKQKAYVDLEGDISQQLDQLFLQALRQRIAAEHRPEQIQDYTERLYESGFRDTVYRRSEQMADLLSELSPEDTDVLIVNEKIDDLMDNLLDLFIIHHCRDINEVELPEAILRYHDVSLHDVSLFDLAMDYLDFENEPLETVHTDFLKMPREALKNASKFFLYPSTDEKILLICDQSLLGACKEGFALTEYGLYWKAQLQTARALQYPALQSIKREKDWLLINGHFFNASKSLNIKLMKLLKKLKKLYLKS